MMIISFISGSKNVPLFLNHENSFNLYYIRNGHFKYSNRLIPQDARKMNISMFILKAQHSQIFS